MKTRLLPLLLALVLFAAACGSDGDDATDAGGDDSGTADVDTGSSGSGSGPSDGSDDGGDDGGSDDDGGWIDGSPDGGSDGASSSDADRSEFAGDDMADAAAPEFIEPPIDVPVDQPLKAGSIDDAADVARYLEYRQSIEQAGVELRPLDVTDSTVFTVVGRNGLPVLDASVQIWAASDGQSGEPLRSMQTRADGRVRFLPNTIDDLPGELRVTVLVDGETTEVDGFTVGTPDVTVEVDAAGGYDGSVPLDVHFVLDSTGSMGDEIERLRSNMTSVAQQIDALPSAPDVRFGMTIYRDEGDDYVARTFDLTDSLDDFLDALDDVRAEGGGDYPEAMDEALADAMVKPDWRREGAVQLMFLIADAPPQIGRSVQMPYAQTALDAAAAGVKIFPIAASGTDDQAEFVMRELAFVTGARFVFLAYGGGDTATGSGTDITNQDFDELPLDQLVVRLVQDELAVLTGVESVQATTPTVPPPTTVPADGQ